MDTSIPQKRCFRCQQLKPATLDYFVAHKQQRDGLAPQCKECENARKRSMYVKKTEVLPDGHKRCTQCKEVYPATTEYFEPFKHSGSGLRPSCRGCRAKDWKAYNNAHAEDHRRYYRNHKVKILEYQKCYYSLNRAQVRERARKNYNPEWRRMYQRTHVMRYRSYNNNRRARKIQAQGTYTHAQIQEQLVRQRYKCYYAACGFAKFNKRDGKYIFQIEHVVPLSRGGSNDISNIVLACPVCNNKKKTSLPHEFPEGGRLL